jgi:transposase-like protein
MNVVRDGNTTSARSKRSAAAERGATRRGASGLTPNEALVVVMLQQGKTVPAIAAEMGCSDRQVRRLRASAIRHGAILDPPEPKRQDAATGAFKPTPKEPPARVRSLITLTEGRGYREAAFHQQPESPEERLRRTGGDGRLDLGPDVAPGEVATIGGRRMVKVSGSTIADDPSTPRRTAIGGFYGDRDLQAAMEEAAAEGYDAVALRYPDGSERIIDLAEATA